MHTYIYIHIHTYARTYTYTYTHKHIHTHPYTHLHISIYPYTEGTQTKKTFTSIRGSWSLRKGINESFNKNLNIILNDVPKSREK